LKRIPRLTVAPALPCYHRADGRMDGAKIAEPAIVEVPEQAFGGKEPQISTVTYGYPSSVAFRLDNKGVGHPDSPSRLAAPGRPAGQWQRRRWGSASGACVFQIRRQQVVGVPREISLTR